MNGSRDPRANGKSHKAVLLGAIGFRQFAMQTFARVLGVA